MKASRLSPRCAIITGGSRGIGRALALAFAKAGADVVVNYLSDKDSAREVVEDITSAGGRAVPVQADIGNLDHHLRLLDAAREHFGRLDILVNNAALEYRSPFLDFTPEDWDRQMNPNLRGVYFLSQAVARHMVEAGTKGRIINLSSTHESRPLSAASIYNISKAGLGMLTKSLALELAPHGITVNSLVPGAIRTDINREVLADPTYESKVLAKIPLGWIADPEDLAAAAVFLASDESHYMTGSNLTLDGGLSL